MPAGEMPANAHGQQLRKRPLPPIQWLKERFQYDPETGAIWTKATDHTGRPRRADRIGAYRYAIVSTTHNKTSHAIPAHRLAFALMTGKWPHLIDHIDQNQSNNTWANLREATAQQNSLNRNSFSKKCGTNDRSGRNAAPADVWETLMRLLQCNKTQLAARLGVTRQTLARWIADTEAGQPPGKAASERAAQLLQATLRAAHSDVHAQWLINWDAIATIGGKR